jgi:uncharacterized repeat protein (TIGR03803 family)
MTRISYAASLALSAAILASLTFPAEAVTYSTLYSFQHPCCGGPFGRLLLRSGSLFGTDAGYTSSDNGQVFELTPSGGSWKEKTLLRFDGTDGANPTAGLIQNSTGALYGTTNDAGAYSYGTVFKLAKSGGVWTETALWNFEGGSERDGATPYAGLHLDSTGALYGTTEFGGDNGYGTVFELTYSGGGWVETVLHSFGGSGDGQNPLGAVIEDSAGNLYGTASLGGAYGYGTVFQITP